MLNFLGVFKQTVVKKLVPGLGNWQKVIKNKGRRNSANSLRKPQITNSSYLQGFSVVYLIFFLIGLGLLFSGGIRPLRADEAPDWQPPVKIYDTDNEIDWPLLLSDASGRLHLLWNEQELEDGEPTGNSTIYYMTKTGNFWSDPVDVLMPGSTYLDGVIDEYGRLHLVMSSLGKPVYFTQTRDANALAAPLWLQPQHLSGPLQTAAAIAIDPAGVLHVVYGGAGSITHIRSEDWGNTWSDVVQIGPSFPAGQAVTGGSISLAIDEEGVLYATWTLGELPSGYPPIRSEFAYSGDGGQSWSTPVEVAPYDFELASMVTGSGQQHTLDIGRAGVGGRYHRWSLDFGRTWSPRLELSPPEEGTGLSGGELALDSANILHAVFGLDAPNTEHDPETETTSESDTIIVYSYWNGKTWSPWVNISGILPAHLERISIEIIQGNRLDTIWASYGVQIGLSNSIWYAEGKIAAPEMETVPLPPIPTPQPTATAVPTSTPTPEAAPPNLESRGVKAQSLVDLPAIALLVGVLSSTMIVGFVFVGRMMTRRR